MTLPPEVDDVGLQRGEGPAGARSGGIEPELPLHEGRPVVHGPREVEELVLEVPRESPEGGEEAVGHGGLVQLLPGCRVDALPEVGRGVEQVEVDLGDLPQGVRSHRGRKRAQPEHGQPLGQARGGAAQQFREPLEALGEVRRVPGRSVTAFRGRAASAGRRADRPRRRPRSTPGEVGPEDQQPVEHVGDPPRQGVASACRRRLAGGLRPPTGAPARSARRDRARRAVRGGARGSPRSGRRASRPRPAGGR